MRASDAGKRNLLFTGSSFVERGELIAERLNDATSLSSVGRLCPIRPEKCLSGVGFGRATNAPGGVIGTDYYDGGDELSD